MEGNTLKNQAVKVSVVIWEPDLTRKSLIFDTCKSASPEVNPVHARDFKHAEQLLSEDHTALFVIANDAIPSRASRKRKFPHRWLSYEQVFRPEELTNKIRDRLGAFQGQHQHTPSHLRLMEMIGECDAIKRLRESIWKLAQQDVVVLVLGETGVGKDKTAELIHVCGPRRSNQFRTISCPGIMESVWDSELNGWTKGSFTGAAKDRAGRIESAHGGTVFLDEVAEIPVMTQAKLLDFLQHRRVTRIGANDSKQVDVRVIAATNKDLKRALKTGEFRTDLYYRLAQTVLEIPPLRQRGKDSILLARPFVKAHSTEQGREFTLHKNTVKWIQSARWPGNVRQLKDRVLLAILNCDPQEAVLLPKHFAT